MSKIYAVVIANEANSDFTSHGEDNYFLIKENSENEIKKIMKDELDSIWDYYEFDFTIISEEVLNKAYEEYDPNYFNDKKNNSNIGEMLMENNSLIEISNSLYNAIMEQALS